MSGSDSFHIYFIFDTREITTHRATNDGCLRHPSSSGIMRLATNAGCLRHPPVFGWHPSSSKIMIRLATNAECPRHPSPLGIMMRLATNAGCLRHPSPGNYNTSGCRCRMPTASPRSSDGIRRQSTNQPTCGFAFGGRANKSERCFDGGLLHDLLIILFVQGKDMRNVKLLRALQGIRLKGWQVIFVEYKQRLARHVFNISNRT
jgi:hypothetical protein